MHQATEKKKVLFATQNVIMYDKRQRRLAFAYQDKQSGKQEKRKSTG